MAEAHWVSNAKRSSTNDTRPSRRKAFFIYLQVMQALDVAFQFSARYYKAGTLNKQTRQLWFVLHGYGQLAQYFIRKFRTLEDHGICVIAPEGLSRFYLEDVSSRVQSGNNRVGATWMTRENRLADIQNYLQYLNAIYTTEVPADNKIPVTILGFSQECRDGYTMGLESKVAIRPITFMGGNFPPDIDFASGKLAFKNKTTSIVYGAADPFLKDDRFAEMKLLSEKLE